VAASPAGPARSVVLEGLPGGYDTTFTRWRDAAGEWIALGGAAGVLLLPVSVLTGGG